MYIISRSRFLAEGSELRAATTRLERWLGRRAIEVSEADTLALKWAEYANPERRFNGSERVEVFVNVEDYASLPQREVKLRCELSTTVRELHEQLFRGTYKNLENGIMCIDPDWVKPAHDTRNPLLLAQRRMPPSPGGGMMGMGGAGGGGGGGGGGGEQLLDGPNSEVYERYVYKVVGCTDFLVHHSFPLGFFDHVITCTARRMRIELALIKLSDGDALDLQSRVREPVSAARRAGRTTGNQHTADDDYRADRDEDEALAAAGAEERERAAAGLEGVSGGAGEAAEEGKSGELEAGSGGGSGSGGKSGEGETKIVNAWRDESFFTMSKINWSFRCMVRGISNLTRNVPPEFLQKYLGDFEQEPKGGKGGKGGGGGGGGDDGGDADGGGYGFDVKPMYNANGWQVKVQIVLCSGGVAVSGGGAGKRPMMMGLPGSPGGMTSPGGSSSSSSSSNSDPATHPDHPDWESAATPSAMLFSNGGFDQEWPIEWVDPCAAGGSIKVNREQKVELLWLFSPFFFARSSF